MATPVYTDDIIPAQNRAEITSVNDEDLLIVSQDNALKKITKANLQETLGVNDKADKTTTYTKTEVNDIADDKVNTSDIIDSLDSTSIDKPLSANQGYKLDQAKADLDSVPTFNGIQFPSAQVASSDVNTLDDYEEGTFTPYIEFDNNSTGIAYSLVVGKYLKIGATVQLHIYVKLTSKGTDSGYLQIKGLPFSSYSGGVSGYQTGSFFVNRGLGSGLFMTPTLVSSYINIFKYAETGTRLYLSNTDISDTFEFVVDIEILTE